MIQLFSVIFISTSFAASSIPLPKVFIDKGACPFECCTYREWRVEKDTDIFDKIGGKKKIGRAFLGTKVIGLTGEVHTIPFKVKNKDGKFLYLLTYQGEGNWKVWQDGFVKSDVGQSWEENNKPTSTWWVKIKLGDGTSGWSKESNNFVLLKSQFVTSKRGSGGKQKLPLVFTENGLAMLSGVLNSSTSDSSQHSYYESFYASQKLPIHGIYFL